jgi:hypothetical protein
MLVPVDDSGGAYVVLRRRELLLAEHLYLNEGVNSGALWDFQLFRLLNEHLTKG